MEIEIASYDAILRLVVIHGRPDARTRVMLSCVNKAMKDDVVKFHPEKPSYREIMAGCGFGFYEWHMNRGKTGARTEVVTNIWLMMPFLFMNTPTTYERVVGGVRTMIPTNEFEAMIKKHYMPIKWDEGNAEIELCLTPEEIETLDHIVIMEGDSGHGTHFCDRYQATRLSWAKHRLNMAGLPAKTSYIKKHRMSHVAKVMRKLGVAKNKMFGIWKEPRVDKFVRGGKHTRAALREIEEVITGLAKGLLAVDWITTTS